MIKLFLSDVDATLTDGIYHTSEQGVISKNFYTRDFHGMWMLNQTGVEVGIITVANDHVITQQCNRGAKYAKVMKGVEDKLAYVTDEFVLKCDMCEEGDPYRIEYPHRKYSWDEIAFIGDDIIDAELLKTVGLAACPLDAADEIQAIVADRSDSQEGEGFRSGYPGGRGCVREFADFVLLINKAEK